MLRSLVLSLLLLVTAQPAFAQLGIADLKDDSARMDTRWLSGYKRTMETRDFFASLHDSIYHPAYKQLQTAHAKYASTKAALEKSIAAGEASAGTKQLAELEDAGEGVAAKLEIYTNSSSAAVEKIQIGLGVFAFLICGIGYLIFRRRKK
jgi:hypothetical protein